MPTYTAKDREVVTIDPSVGWTINAPVNPANGSHFTVKSVDLTDETNVSYNASAGDEIQSYSSGKATVGFTAPLYSSGSVTWIYNAGILVWQIQGIGIPQGTPSSIYSQTTPTIITTDTPLPITYQLGDKTRFTESGGNLLTAQRDLAVFGSDFFVNISASGPNNSDALVTITAVVTSANTQIVIPVKWPFQTSRAPIVPYEATVNTSMLLDLSTGDTLQLQGTNLGNMTVTVESFLWLLDGSTDK